MLRVAMLLLLRPRPGRSEAVHNFHGDNHPAIMIKFGEAPLVFSGAAGQMDLTFRPDGAIKGFRYRIIVQELSDGKLLQNKALAFSLDDFPSGEAVVRLWISDIRQDSFRFAIGIWDTVVGGADTLLARKDATVPLTFDFRALFALWNRMRRAAHLPPRWRRGRGRKPDTETMGGAALGAAEGSAAVCERQSECGRQREPGGHASSHASSAPQCVEEVLLHAPTGARGVDVTLATVASADRCVISLYAVAHWDGPVSVAYFARDEAERDAIIKFVRTTLEPFCRDRQQQLSVTLVYHCRHASDQGASDQYTGYTGGPARQHRPRASSSAPALPALELPINVMRQAAVAQSQSDWGLILDVDFSPSTGAHDALRHALALGSPTGQGPERQLLVLPCFWPAGRGTWPKAPEIDRDADGRTRVLRQNWTKTRLVADLVRQRATTDPPGTDAPHSHFGSNYLFWLTQDVEEAPYPAAYTWFYEPYFVLNVSAWRGVHGRRLFDGSFPFGSGDKAQLAWEAATLGYSFKVLPGAFVMHVPAEWIQPKNKSKSLACAYSHLVPAPLCAASMPASSPAGGEGAKSGRGGGAGDALLAGGESESQASAPTDEEDERPEEERLFWSFVHGADAPGHRRKKERGGGAALHDGVAIDDNDDLDDDGSGSTWLLSETQRRLQAALPGFLQRLPAAAAQGPSPNGFCYASPLRVWSRVPGAVLERVLVRCLRRLVAGVEAVADWYQVQSSAQGESATGAQNESARMHPLGSGGERGEGRAGGALATGEAGTLGVSEEIAGGVGGLPVDASPRAVAVSLWKACFGIARLGVLGTLLDTHIRRERQSQRRDQRQRDVCPITNRYFPARSALDTRPGGKRRQAGRKAGDG